jgi:signal transduction histidine kinase
VQQTIDPAPLSESLLFQLLEEERYRLARALQRGPGQVLANAVMEAEHALPLLQTRPEDAARGLELLLEELKQGLDELRSLVAELQPALLAELGLVAALDKYLASFGRRTGIPAGFDASGSPAERLPSILETAIFRIVQESLDNVSEHSGASQVQVTLTRAGDQIVTTISDDGRGFPTAEENRNPRRPLGLVSMRDRARSLGGRLQLYSEPGRGVRVVLTIPYRERSQTLEEIQKREGT